jgi:hypothetical protein
MVVVLGHHQGQRVWKPRGGRRPDLCGGAAEEPYDHTQEEQDAVEALAPQSSSRIAMMVLEQQQGQI